MKSKNSIWIIILLAIAFCGCSNRNHRAAPLAHNSSNPAMKADYLPDAPALQPYEPTGTITLRDAIAHALLNNPKLKTFSLDIRAAEARKLQAGLLPNPELAVTTEQFGGSEPHNRFDGAETTITVVQPIEMGGKRDRRSQVATLEKKLAIWDYEVSRLEMIRQTGQVFAEVLGAQQKIKLTKDQMDLAQQLFNTVLKRVEAGKDLPSEAAKAQIEFTQAQMEHQRAVSILIDAKHRLAILWGAASPGFENVEGNLDIHFQIPALDGLKQQAQEHPQVLRWRDEQDLGQAQLSLAKARSESDIALTAGLKRLEQEDDNTAVIGLAVPLPIFNRNQGAIAAARHEISKIEQQRIQALTQFESQLAQYRLRLEAALSYASMLKDPAMAKAMTVFESARKGYEEGKFDYLHLLDAQRTFFNIESQLLEAQISVRLAQADLEYAVGQSIEPTQTILSNKGIEE